MFVGQYILSRYKQMRGEKNVSLPPSACKRTNQHFLRASSSISFKDCDGGKEVPEVTRSGEGTADIAALSIEAALV